MLPVPVLIERAGANKRKTVWEEKGQPFSTRDHNKKR
jgi:hypothetical protein